MHALLLQQQQQLLRLQQRLVLRAQSPLGHLQEAIM
jgi:hypothetical protein